MTLEQRLHEAGTRRADANDFARTARHELHTLVRAAVDEGMTKTAVALHAGISRQAVHDIIRGGVA